MSTDVGIGSSAIFGEAIIGGGNGGGGGVFSRSDSSVLFKTNEGKYSRQEMSSY